jgi:hypothetical protein
MLPEPADIFAAVMAKLLNDATLMGLMPDGVYRDIAPAGKGTDEKQRFVIVSKMADVRSEMFNGTAWEEFTYLVKAVQKGVSGLVANQAAARIHNLLQDSTLTIPGYALMAMKIAEDNGVIEMTEPDPDDLDTRWQHRGWLFEVTVSPA